MHESSREEIDKRILKVSKMLLSGFSTPEILQYASKSWGITDRQTRTYISRCYDLWHKDFEKKRKRNLDYHLAKRRDLYKEAYNKKQWNICLEIIRDEAKLGGLYIERQEVGPPGSFVEWVEAVKEEKERRRKKNSNSNR